MRSKIIAKLAAFTVFSTSLISLALAHGEEEPTTTGMMDGSWMHTGADMMGYNMWGIGWFGPLLTIGILVLVILGIIYLYQQITEK